MRLGWDALAHPPALNTPPAGLLRGRWARGHLFSAVPCKRPSTAPCPPTYSPTHQHPALPCRDTDPNGLQLAATPDPLGEAAKLLRRLREHAGQQPLVQQLSFEVFLRQGKLLLALQAAKKAAALSGAADPAVHSMVARLADAVVAAAAAPQDAPGALPAQALEVAQAETAALLGAGEVSPAAAAAYRQQWAAAHAGSSLRHAAAAAEVALPDARPAAVQRLLAAGPAGASHADCAAVLELLSDRLALPEAAEQWRRACAESFRRSAVFGGADCVQVPAPWEAAAAEAEGGEGSSAAAANGVAEQVSQLAI